MLRAGEAEAWRLAAADLGIEVEIGSDTVVVRNFGSAAGMLCAVRETRDEIADLRRRAEHTQVGWSARGPGCDSYDREGFIDTLNDWGWTGAGAPSDWYTGVPHGLGNDA